MEELDKLLQDSEKVEEKIELIEAPVQLKSLFKETKTLGIFFVYVCLSYVCLFFFFNVSKYN